MVPRDYFNNRATSRTNCLCVYSSVDIRGRSIYFLFVNSKLISFIGSFLYYPDIIIILKFAAPVIIDHDTATAGVIRNLLIFERVISTGIVINSLSDLLAGIQCIVLIMAKFIGALDFIIISFCLDTRESVFADEFAIS